jgi:hypothetical protein
MLKTSTVHCVDLIRQQLMCNLDTTVSGAVWMNLHDDPKNETFIFAKLNLQQKCKNFNDVRDWVEKNQLPAKQDAPADFIAPRQVEDHVYADFAELNGMQQNWGPIG